MVRSKGGRGGSFVERRVEGGIDGPCQAEWAWSCWHGLAGWTYGLDGLLPGHRHTQ